MSVLSKEATGQIDVPDSRSIANLKGMDVSSGSWIARAVQHPDGSVVSQPLMDHLRGVAALCKRFALPFCAEQLSSLTGLWHDLGKFASDWQRFIRAATGINETGVEDAHLEAEDSPRRHGPDHSSAGALHAIERLGPIGQMIAQLIAAHHAGLYDAIDLEMRLQKPEKIERFTAALAGSIPAEILDASPPDFNSAPFQDETPGAYALFLRMLFSCLVDADRLDSEAFGDGIKHRLRSGFPDLEELRLDFDAHMGRFVADTPVKRLRAEILDDCRKAAIASPGLFTLTVPTGGGKTLSSLAFALEHAAQHGLKRVIYVIPYTSIIEQTADVFRGISPAFAQAVVEHHSNVNEKGDDNAHGGATRESERMKLATENWEAPIVVTTSVQFFESLFAAKTSRCRKLHNVCESVVILDEAQLLPPAFLQPILDALNLLTRHYRTTVVISTATQPALASTQRFGTSFRGLDQPKEIIPDVDRLYRALRRVEVRLPNDLQSRDSWASLAEKIGYEGDVLTIVGRRADARELWRRLPEGALHLSGLMCGAHRSDVIAQIKRRLSARLADTKLPPVRVVSTQLVEAGVDLDFPVVYRAFAGLDSIAQAAGRCNREGRLTELGRVEVFVPPKGAPAGTLRFAEQAAEEVLHGHQGDPLDRSLFEPYFRSYYNVQDRDEKKIVDLLKVDEASCGVTGLRTAAERFKLIDNDETGYQSVLVPYRRDDGDDAFEKLVATLKKEGPTRWLMRKLQRYSVSLPPYEFQDLRDRKDLEEAIPGIWIVRSAAQYSRSLGLILDLKVLTAEVLAI